MRLNPAEVKGKSWPIIPLGGKLVNRLKSLPWTQIMLFLLLVTTVANYFELREIKDVVYSIDSRINRLQLSLP